MYEDYLLYFGVKVVLFVILRLNMFLKNALTNKIQ